MGKDPVSDRTFKESGKTDDKIAPGKAEYDNRPGNKQYQPAKAKQSAWCYRHAVKTVNPSLDDSGNGQLEKINENKSGKPCSQPQTMSAIGGNEQLAQLREWNSAGARLLSCRVWLYLGQSSLGL